MRLSTHFCVICYNVFKRGKNMKKHENRLKDLRLDKDLTQADVAKLFFLQLTQYRRYENGESDLPLEWAKKFAIFYNVSIDYIAGLIDVPKQLK